MLIVDSHFQVISEGANTDWHDTFRYSLVAAIETSLFQITYMNNIAPILFVGIFFLILDTDRINKS